MTTKEEKLAKLEEKLENTCQKLDDFENGYSEFKTKVFEKLDSISDKMARIETKIETQQEERKQVLNIRIWLIGLTVTTVLTVIGLFLRR